MLGDLLLKPSFSSMSLLGSSGLASGSAGLGTRFLTTLCSVAGAMTMNSIDTKNTITSKTKTNMEDLSNNK
jgi:hypothetical protein